ncbi:MAG: bifunctional riboflavin kinase/FAD synthetase [Parachlamydiaceae bacterium]
MRVAYNFDDISDLPQGSSVVTIGSFDGIHLGHQVVLDRLVRTGKTRNARSVVITFSNHPSEVLRPEQHIHQLCTTAHKIKLLEEMSIDLVFLLSFTKKLAEKTPKQFLSDLLKVIPFHTLILGEDAHIGKNREGNKKKVTELSAGMGFEVEYLSDCAIAGSRISSSRIRSSIQHGRFDEAELLLGRPYSIYAPVLKGHGRGAPLGFPTANISVEGLCLPPHGVYTVSLWHQGQRFEGVANLGYAPTLHQDRALLLEVHLFDKTIDLYGHYVDVHFHKFLRPEQRFDSVEALKKQIAHDIQQGKACFFPNISIA